MMSSTQVAEPGACTGASEKSHSCSAQAHLRRGFFARDVNRASATLGIFAERLKDQRGFADAGIAADEQRRSWGRWPPPVTRSNSLTPVTRRGVEVRPRS